MSAESAEWNGLRVESGAKEESQYLLRLMRCVRGCAGCGCEEPPARCRVLLSFAINRIAMALVSCRRHTM